MANFRRRKNVYANGNGVSGRASRRMSADRISQNPIQGMRPFDASSEVMNGFSGYNDDYNGFNSSSNRGIVWSGAAGNQGGVAAKQAGGECTPPNVYCKAGDYYGCHPQHKCNSAGAKQVSKKSRRSSADRIASKPVMGKSKPQAGERGFVIGQTYGAREVNAGMNDCGQRCGSAYPNSYRCPDGCMCDGKGRGTCVPVKGRLSSNDATARNINFSASGRKSRRASMDRLSINPVRGRANFRGFNASGCGNYIN